MKNKKVIVSLIISLLVISCTNETQINDLSKLKLKGKVKSFTKISYTAYNIIGEITKHDYHEMSYKFNEHGNKTELQSNKWNAGPYYKKVYKYSEDGYLTEEREYDTNDSLVDMNIY
ncbi:unnamed protein product, partial [Chrysoparadoxa australica]